MSAKPASAAALRAPCPACGVVDRVVPASEIGGYRMIRHTAPAQNHYWRGRICTGKALIAVASIVEQARRDRADQERAAIAQATHRADVIARHEATIAASHAREALHRETIAALDKALAKLTAAMEARAAVMAEAVASVKP